MSDSVNELGLNSGDFRMYGGNQGSDLSSKVLRSENNKYNQAGDNYKIFNADFGEGLDSRYSYKPYQIKDQKTPNWFLKFWNIKIIAVILVIMSLVGFFLFLTQNTTTKKQAEASDLFTPEQVINAVNKERRKVGLPSLTTNTKLMKSAQNKALDMNKNDYFAHISPKDGKKWSDFIKNANYEYLVAGENLAKGFDDVEIMVDAWMNSPAHKENIVSQKVDETGVGIFRGTLKGRETVFVVQVFGKQMSEEERTIFMKDEDKEKKKDKNK